MSDIPDNKLKTFKFRSRGSTKMNFDWSTNVVAFESGKKQYQQKLQIPFRTITGTFSGLIDTWTELQNFFLYHKQQIPFYVYYLNNRYKVRFANATLEPAFNQEISQYETKQVGFSVDIAFSVENDRWDWNNVLLDDTTYLYDFDPMPNISYPAVTPGFNDSMTQYIDCFGNIWRLTSAKLAPTYTTEFPIGLTATDENFCVQLMTELIAEEKSISVECVCRFESTQMSMSLGNLGYGEGVAGYADINVYNDRYAKNTNSIDCVFGNQYSLQYNPLYLVLAASFKTKKIQAYIGGGSYFGLVVEKEYSDASAMQEMICNGLNVANWGIGNFCYKIRVKTPADPEFTSMKSDLAVDSNTVAFFDAT